MQLMRMHRSLSSSDGTSAALSVSAVSTSGNSSCSLSGTGGSMHSLNGSNTNSHYHDRMTLDRQRIFARLVDAAAAVQEPTFFPPQSSSTPSSSNSMTSPFPSHHNMQVSMSQSRNYGMPPAQAHPNSSNWDHVSPDVSQYLQFQAFKRLQQHQQQQQHHQQQHHQQQQHQQQRRNHILDAAALSRSNSEYSVSGSSWSAASNHGSNNNMLVPTFRQPNGPFVMPSQQGGGHSMNIGNSSMGMSSFRSGCGTSQNGGGNLMNMFLPAVLARPEDAFKVSRHQVLLRHQIEAFQATEADVSTHTRGRNKPIKLGQVGIRCRHCAHLPVKRDPRTFLPRRWDCTKRRKT
jgi:hypothetical protein